MELFIPGPVGRLEARHEPPEGEVRAVAAVCHPHPLYGGTMDNTVVFRTAKALRRAGVAVARFNFRGVGESEGEHGGNGEEEGDAAAVLDWLAARHPGVPRWAAGFSFGSRTALGLALDDERIERLVCVALPVLRFACEGVERVRQRSLFVFAGEDEFGTLAAMRERVPRIPDHFDLVEIPGTDHFFKYRTPDLESAVHSWATREIEDTP